MYEKENEVRKLPLPMRRDLRLVADFSEGARARLHFPIPPAAHRTHYAEECGTSEFGLCNLLE